MDPKQQRLVARLRHHNPTLTVTELHIDRIDHSKKNLLIDYLGSLRLNHTVETSPNLETVVSVDISSWIEQDDIFKKLLAFIRDIGIGDVSITSEPFDEQQPEIESVDSIAAAESSLKDYSPINSDDMDDLISSNKSESEFELILSRPRRSSSRNSRWYHIDQSSRDVIGSILRVSEGRSQGSGESHYQRPALDQERSSQDQKPQKKTFWSRTKSMFKRIVNAPKQSVGQFQVMVSNDSIQEIEGYSSDKRKPKVFSVIRGINTKINQEQVTINTLQKRLEKVSHDVFCMRNKCPKNIDSPPLDAYTQTQHKDVEEADMKNLKTQAVHRKSSSIVASSGKNYTQNISEFHSNERSLSEMSVISESTDSGDQVMNGIRVAKKRLRGMINYIPVYPNLKRAVICGMKPVDAPFFFRRLIPGKSSSHSTTTSCFTTTTSASLKSARSTLTFSSSSFPSTSQGQNSETGRIILENIFNTRSKKPFSCGVVSTNSDTPFEQERLKNTQTVNPLYKATEVNTSGVFKLPKVTQTRPRKKKKTIPDNHKAPAVGTQTLACSSSTSCTDLFCSKSCGTKTENEVQTFDKENSCNLLTKNSTEDKETTSQMLMLKCESCHGMLGKQVGKKMKSSGGIKNDRRMKRGLGWGEYPDGNFGFGQSYAPGKVFPVISLATGFSFDNPFSLPAPLGKGDNPRNTCPKICNMFGSKRRALLEELNKQKMELLQMRMVLVAINEELLAECTDSSSDENQPSSEDPSYYFSEFEVPLKQNKKVTFRDPLVKERSVKYAENF